MEKLNVDWGSWYSDSLQFFESAFYSYTNAYNFLWFTIAKDVKDVVKGDGAKYLCCDIVGSLMTKFTGDNRGCSEFVHKAFEESQKYKYFIKRYEISSIISCQGDFWTEYCNGKNNDEIAEIAKKIMPFWCFHSAYTKRYVECVFNNWNCNKYSKLDYPFSNIANEIVSDYLDLIYDSIYKNSDLPLMKLIDSMPKNIDATINQSSIEDLYFYLLSCNMDYIETSKYAHIIGHSMQLSNRHLEFLRQHNVEESQIKAYSKLNENRIYIPSKRAMARIMLSKIDLINEEKM